MSPIEEGALQLTKTMLVALADVRSYNGRRSGYSRHWKTKTVAKLVSAGLVEDRGDGDYPIWITDAGRDALQKG